MVGIRLRTASIGSVTLLIGAALIVCAGLSLLVGAGSLADDALRGVFLRLRLTRFFASFLCGASLAVAGVLVQGLFRNPLASPSVIGTTAGASLGGKVALIATELVGFDGFVLLGLSVNAQAVLPLGSVVGALGALAILLAVTRVKQDRVVVLLTGFLLSSLFISLGGLLMTLVQERWELARAMVSFALGDVSGAGLSHLALAAPLVVVGSVMAFTWGASLDLMLSGEDEATSLGVDVPNVRKWTIVWVSVLTAAAVAVAGNIGFVGLVVPHALRPWVGEQHRRLIPASALGGGVFVVTCDLVARLVPAQSELPLGVVTGLIGAPLFLYLLRKSRAEG